MKWISSLTIVIAITWMGFEYSRNLAQRPKLIQLFKNALQILETEIIYSQTSIRSACNIVANQTPKPISVFFANVASALEREQNSLYAIWEKEMEKFYQQHSIHYEDKEILNQFGRTLGQHDVSQQQKHIRLTITHLDRKLQDAERINQRYGKMPSSIGFLAGLFIVLLLL